MAVFHLAVRPNTFYIAAVSFPVGWRGRSHDCGASRSQVATGAQNRAHDAMYQKAPAAKAEKYGKRVGSGQKGAC